MEILGKLNEIIRLKILYILVFNVCLFDLCMLDLRKLNILLFSNIFKILLVTCRNICCDIWDSYEFLSKFFLFNYIFIIFELWIRVYIFLIILGY